MIKTAKTIQIGPVHPGRGEPSRIELWLVPDDRKSGQADVYTVTEEQALLLAERALMSARVIRGNGRP